MMERRYIQQWCDTAVSYIRFPPDREPVRQELLEHLEDACEFYIAQGLEPARAEQSALRDMGDARETGKLLAKIHRPYLGWLWRLTQWVLGILVVLTVISGVRYCRSLSFTATETARRDVYGDSSYVYEDPEAAYRLELYRTLYTEPMVTAYAGGYRFTVTRAAEWQGTVSERGESREYRSFYYTIEVFSPCPWAGATSVPRWMYGVDSQGSYYYSCYESGSTGACLRGNGSRAGMFTYTWDMWVEDYASQDAQWLELRYERDGRDLVLRIDLTGGEGA